MKRPCLFLGMLAAVAGLATLASAPNPELLILQWAKKAQLEKPPAAILIELGLKDKTPTDWSGQAIVRGAKVVHREGYRFRKTDILTGETGWQASSHTGLRVPPKTPAVSKMEGIATVGVVLHLADVKDAATLTIEPNNG